MKSLLKKASLLLIASSFVIGLAACGGASQSSGNSQDQASSASGASAQPTENSLPIVSEPLTLKFVCYNWGDAEYGNDMTVFKELEKRTNIHLDWQLLPADDNLTKLNLIMASGELPDIVSYSDAGSKSVFDKYASSGAIVPLDDLINSYAPNIKSFFENPPYSMPSLKADSKGPDGKIYSLPGTTEVGTGEIFAIRKDWLDAVSMKVPDTTDDLYNVLKAFKDNNLSGDGNTIPLCPDSGLPDLTILMNAFGSHESFYVDYDDNTIQYGPLEESYKEGLAYCNKLYSEGLIDANYINANDSDTFRGKIAKNEVGMFYAWPLSGLGYGNTAVAKLDPSYEYVGMLPVKGPNGDRYKERPQSSVTPRTVITASNKHTEETIKYLDYLFSEDGQILMNYGVEGEDYTMQSGKQVFTDKILNNPDGLDAATVRLNEGMQVGLPFIATYDCESQTALKSVSDTWKLYIDNDALYPNFPNLPLDEATIGDISGKLTDIKTYVQEHSNNFIMGTESLDNFDGFVSEIKKMGIDDILSAYSKAYTKYDEYNK